MSNRSNVTDCYNRGVVYSKGYSGGIVGIGDNYKVTRCYVKAPEKSTVAKGKYGIDCSSGQAGGLIGNSKDLTLERCFWYSSCAKVAWGQYSLSGTHSGNDYDYYYYQVRFKNPDNFPTYDFKNVWYIDTTSGADAPGLLFETKLTVSDVANTGGQGGTGAVGMGLAGEGTEENPYRISSAEDFNILSNYVSSGKKTEGFFFRQMTNFETSDIVGNDNYPFMGTYDGDGYTLTFNYDKNELYNAPFRVVKNATIKNLKTAGTITTGSKFAAGLIGKVLGEVTVSGCVSSVTINSNINGDGTHGGFVGVTMDESKLTVEGCVFNGAMKGSSTICCGGFVGFARNEITVKNCVFAPTVFEYLQSATFTRYYLDRNESITTLKNNYFFTLVSNIHQGKQGYPFTADSNIKVGFGENKTSYEGSGITAYDTGLEYNGTFYAGMNDTLQPSLSAKNEADGAAPVFKTSRGNLNYKDGSYKFNMPPGPVNVSIVSATVTYVDAQGKNMGSRECISVKPNDTELNNGWYAAISDVTINSRVEVKGDVNLILCDGADLKIPKGVNVPKGSSLTIWQQKNKTGKLTVTDPEKNYSGIGGGYKQDTGNITINGGVINVKATYDAAGIGGYAGSAGKIIINGGNITAQGGGLSAAIGSGGGYGSGGEVTVNGGKITAIGGTGGVGGAAGIGASHHSGKTAPGKLLTININGGDISAQGGNFASGIGGGSNRYCDIAINIKAGTINAKGGMSGAGIGGGRAGTGGTINISGGAITAAGGSNGAGIGGGADGAGGTINITGGVVTAESGSNAVAIGHGNNNSDNGTLNLGNDSTHYKIATVSSDNKLNYVDSSKRMSTCQNSGKIHAEICNNHEYANGICKYCGVDAPEFTVTFTDENGKTLKSYKVRQSLMPEFDGVIPQKQGTGDISYYFSGWSPKVELVTGNVTYKATYGICGVGDVNIDGKVNGSDAGILTRYTSGWANYDKKIKNMKLADINGDGKINGADAGILSRYTSG